MKSRRVGFCLSSHQEEVTGCKSWRHRHPPTDPSTHTVFSASPTLPRSPFQTLSVSTAVSALPTHSTSSPPSLTAPTAPLPLSSLGRPCNCFRSRSIQRLPMCAQAPTAPTVLTAPTPPHHPGRVFKGFRCVPKPPPPPPLSPPPRHPPTDPGRPCKCFGSISWPPLQVF